MAHVETAGTQTTYARLWIRPLIVDLGCCGVSALAIGAPRYDVLGLNGSAYDLSPEQANVSVVAGRVSPTFAPALRALHSRIAMPRWVIAYGTCAVSGAVFDTLATDQIIPVDILMGGCPPLPDTLSRALAHISRRRRT
jgi:NADH-quinone oxidoreductase subunit B